MSLDRLPPLTVQLLKELDAAIPPRCITPGETLEAAHRYAGKRELIDALLRALEEERENPLESPTHVYEAPPDSAA